MKTTPTPFASAAALAGTFPRPHGVTAGAMFGRVFHEGDGVNPPGTTPPAGQQGQPGTPPAITFTPEQTVKLNEIYNDAFAKGAAKAEKDANAKIQKLEADLKDATTKLEEAGKGGEGKPGAKYTQEQMDQALAKALEEPQRLLKDAQDKAQKLQDAQKTLALRAAAEGAKAVNSAMVAKLIADQVTFNEDGQLVVLNEQGAPQLNAEGKPMTVEQHVKGFVDANPYLKAGANTGGTGSGTNPPGAPGGQQQQAPRTFAEAGQALAHAFGNAPQT